MELIKRLFSAILLAITVPRLPGHTSNDILDEIALWRLRASREFLELSDIRNNMSLMQKYSLRELQTNNSANEEEIVPTVLIKLQNSSAAVGTQTSKTTVKTAEGKERKKRSKEGESLGHFIEYVRLTAERRDIILRSHNLWRNEVASGAVKGKETLPAAQNMREMVWDDYLAERAKPLMRSCWNGHIIHHDPDGKPLGQNLAMHKTTKNLNVYRHFEKYIYNMTEGWYNEKDNWYYQSDTKISGTGHFTQIIWANTWKIGCAVGRCVDEKNSRFWFALYLVCDYQPAGNVGKQKPYLEGKQNCSGLQLAEPGRFNFLCASNSPLVNIFSKQILLTYIVFCIYILFVVNF